MHRPLDGLRLAPAFGVLVLASCGHLGIDLIGDGGPPAGTGAASIAAVGGEPGSGGTGAGPAAGGTVGSGASPSADGGSDASGGSTGSGATTGAGGEPTAGGGGTGGGSGGDAATGGATSCEGGTEADFSLVGWAEEAGGTTGGKGGDTVSVWAGGQLQNELANKNPLVPLTLLIQNTISQNNTGDDKIDIADVSDVSIIGVGDQGVFDGMGLRIIRASNIVIRNVHIHHVDVGEMDSIGLAGPADHIWIDHCEFDAEFQSVPEGTYDGLIDAKADVSHVTYSWNYIHDAHNPLLVGSTETDSFDRKLTMHHNRIENCGEGAPSFRAGNGHIFNNFYADIVTLGINSRMGACLRVENNVFSNVRNPWVSAHSAELGSVEHICNQVDENSIFESTADISPAPDCTATVPYDYSSVLTETSAVEALVKEHAGFGTLVDPEDF